MRQRCFPVQLHCGKDGEVLPDWLTITSLFDLLKRSMGGIFHGVLVPHWSVVTTKNASSAVVMMENVLGYVHLRVSVPNRY